MKPAKQPSKKVRAQAMVEFALALPVLLLIIYGLLETGRLLFIYASTVTAARQAVRYGSATGLNDSGVEYYKDCAGIEAAVRRVGFINTFDQIVISYDGGPTDTNPPLSCPPSALDNGDRIHVTVRTQWTPIVPLVPFKPFIIRSESYRTILGSVAIIVEAPESGWTGTGSGELSLALDNPPVTYNAVGEVLAYNYTLANSGNEALTGPFSLSTAKTGGTGTTSTTCGAVPVTLPGDDATPYPCSVSYSTIQSDLDSGSIIFDAQAFGTGVSSNVIETSASADQSPALQLTKTGSPYATSIQNANITYTYTLTNTGNVTLASPFTVTDDKIRNVTCPASPSLAPAATMTCTATYSVGKADIDNGRIVNVATAHATFDEAPVHSNQATFTVYTPPIFLSVDVSPTAATQAGQQIRYTYTLWNGTEDALLPTFTVSDSRISVTCPQPNSLANGATLTCTGTYTVTQADLNSGTAIMSTASASARLDKGNKPTVYSNEVTTTLPMSQTRALSLQMTPDRTTATSLGTVVTYNYVLTNSGNVTLSQPLVITDDKASNITCTDPTTSMAPGATKTCSGSRTISQADLDAGSVTNQASASATFGTQTIPSSTQSATVITYSEARLGLSISPDPTSVTGSGAQITYTYTLTNTGGVTLSAPFSVADDMSTDENCSLAAASLGLGASTTCSGTYTTTADDVTAGFVTNTAIASGKSGDSIVMSPAASSTVTVAAPMVCDVKHSTLSLPSFGMTIYNNNAYSITISSIMMIFNDSPADEQSITWLYLGGANIWHNDNDHGSPKTISSDWNNIGNLTIPANSSSLLEVTEWDVPYTINTTEQIIISFTNSGCPQLDSSNNSQLQ